MSTSEIEPSEGGIVIPNFQVHSSGRQLLVWYYVISCAPAGAQVAGKFGAYPGVELAFFD